MLDVTKKKRAIRTDCCVKPGPRHPGSIEIEIRLEIRRSARFIGWAPLTPVGTLSLGTP
jgi:hypothetical protein